VKKDTGFQLLATFAPQLM